MTVRYVKPAIVVLLVLAATTSAKGHESGVKQVRCKAINFNSSTWRGKCSFLGFEGLDVRLVLRVKARWDVVLPDGHRSVTTRRKVRTCLTAFRHHPERRGEVLCRCLRSPF